MTRPTIDTFSFKTTTGYAPHGRPPADKIDKRFAPIFARLDKLKENRSAAEELVNHLAQPARDAEATNADDTAAAEAIAKGKNAPDRDNEHKLAADRKQSGLNLAGYALAIQTVEAEAEALRDSITPSTADLEARRENIRAMVETLKTEHAAFLTAEAVHEWNTRGIYLSRTNYNPQDLLPALAAWSGAQRYNTAPTSELFNALADTLTN
ncbi:hypothetical protein J2X01_000722 [Arthrobacter ginsengisoli]|uniref:Uncharacterized protein n=1 Tax=Arthrobacter ginsengisoli TaxID=1356565 RepID=A0ABU1U8L2_9MICC|nr:hypothetical protein [Arthrobacter ginsengisoli]MDR7081445.1 hypothetical protein [Arthrobacter ginsengisoli]